MKPAAHRPRRRFDIQSLIGLLVIGAIVNVVVAWACATEWAKGLHSYRRATTSDDLAWLKMCDEQPFTGWMAKSSRGESFLGYSGEMAGSIGRDRLFTYLQDSAFEARQETVRQPTGPGSVTLAPQFTAYRVRTGWPFRIFQDYRIVHTDDWKLAHPGANLVESSGEFTARIPSAPSAAHQFGRAGRTRTRRHSCR